MLREDIRKCHNMGLFGMEKKVMESEMQPIRLTIFFVALGQYIKEWRIKLNNDITKVVIDIAYGFCIQSATKMICFLNRF